jgi:lysophospholipase L1-like esterase
MSPTASSRPRRSRAGLVVVLLVLAMGAWEVVGRASGSSMVTPVRFACAAWSVAGGGSASGGAGPPSAADMARIAYRPLPYVNYGLKPSWTRTSDKPDAPLKTTNSLGFRGREVEQPKPAGRYRIACLGGSTTYDDGVADGDTYPLKLEGLLRAAHPERDLEVVNCGVPSYTSAESLANLAFRVLDLQPDAIVLYEGINDWRTRNYVNYDGAYFHFRKVWDGSTAHWDAGPPGTEMAGGINPLIQFLQPAENGDIAENIKRSGFGAFRRNLQSMCGIARAHGVAVVMVSNVVDESNPAKDPIFPIFLAGMVETNQVVQQVCKETGSLFVDLDASWPKGAQAPPGRLFVDQVHNNPAGAQIKARIIADAMLKDLLK